MIDVSGWDDISIGQSVNRQTGNFIMSSTLKSLRALSDQTRLRMRGAACEKEELSVNGTSGKPRTSGRSQHLHASRSASGSAAPCQRPSRREGKRTFYRVLPARGDAIARAHDSSSLPCRKPPRRKCPRHTARPDHRAEAHHRAKASPIRRRSYFDARWRGRFDRHCMGRAVRGRRFGHLLLRICCRHRWSMADLGAGEGTLLSETARPPG